VTVSFAVQAHQSRWELAEQLARKIGGEVVYDPDPLAAIRSPWRTYRRLLESTPSWATHRLQIQDDADACPYFAEAVTNAVTAQPDRLLVFYVGGNPNHFATAVTDACARGDAWVDLAFGYWCPAVSVCWPVGMIDRCLAWVDDQRWPETFTADDEIIGRWLYGTGGVPLASVPSLAQHWDIGDSLSGRRPWAGEDPGRVAACYIGSCDDCMDAREIAWS
jgi:hypothetical protein